MFGKLPLATLGLVIGTVLTLGGFVAYFTNHPTLNLAGFFYGFPLLLGGLALKASELKPVPALTEPSPEVLALREQQATYTQTKLRKDITRYRYGQDVHLDEALKKVGLVETDDDLPILEGYWESAIASCYAITLRFDSEEVPLETWLAKQEKIEKFFGPDLKAQITQPETHYIELALIATPASA